MTEDLFVRVLLQASGLRTLSSFTRGRRNRGSEKRGSLRFWAPAPGFGQATGRRIQGSTCISLMVLRVQCFCSPLFSSSWGWACFLYVDVDGSKGLDIYECSERIWQVSLSTETEM